MELFLDVLGESLVDTAKMLPFLFLAYLLIEYIEHRHGERNPPAPTKKAQRMNVR
mgnify:CR=1 FL=1